MKISTRISDLNLSIDLDRADKNSKDKLAQVNTWLKQAYSYADRAKSEIDTLANAQLNHSKCRENFEAIPKVRREQADKLKVWAQEYALRVARKMGGDYSGQVLYSFSWENIANAYTSVSSGDQYSRSCTYKKNDANHVVKLAADGMPLLNDSLKLVEASFAEGLPLIALYSNNKAIWVRNKNKSIVSESGYVVYDSSRNICYHSLESLEKANKGLSRKVKAYDQEKLEIETRRRTERRAQLVARLCGKVSATITDAKNLGYCEVGIRSFQSRHNIGNSATLPQLLQTGDSSAIRLALSIARKVSSSNRMDLAQQSL